MLTQDQLDALRPQWREFDAPGIGRVLVRGPTYRDIAGAIRIDRPEWWLESCVKMPDGSPLLPPGADVMELDGVAVRAIENEVFRPHPTRPPTGGCSPNPQPPSSG